MKVYDSNKLRNVAILGHSGSGKTNLVDALAYTTSISKKMPKVSDKQNMTYSIGLAPVEHNGVKYNFRYSWLFWFLVGSNFAWEASGSYYSNRCHKP